MKLASALVPVSFRGYQRSWLTGDVLAGATLAAVAIPETMGYTSIAQTPIVTGLYTIIFPTILFVILGSSRLLVVGADSATAALLAAGLGAAAISGVTPGSREWLAYMSVIALICGLFLVLARVFRLGFLGDFLSASVLVGFLTGVGVQVLSGQIPDMLGVPKGTGTWFQQQWDMLTSLGQVHWPTFAFAAGTLAIILGFKKFLPRIPGAIIAVVLSIVVSSLIDASADGVAIVGAVQGGFPPLGLPEGITLTDVTDNMATLLSIGFACFVLIVAQSAATSRSFAMKHGESVDINRDIVGLSGANFAAGLTGTFVVNGSPTKTQILDGQKGRTQLANLTMSLITLLVVLFFTGLLANMPKAVLGAIVFLIGVDLIDIAGLRLIRRMRRAEFVIAAITAVVVCAVGVEQGIILAIVVSILNIIRRQYSPKDFVVGFTTGDEPTYQAATPGQQSKPGLIIFRFDAELFYANSNRYVDDVQRLIEAAPDPVEWLVMDASSLDDVDYSAGKALDGLLDYLAARKVTPVLARVDASLASTLGTYGILGRIGTDHVYGNLVDAYHAFEARTPAPAS
ncbi:MAG: SulP family inorganic anion transporter [Actinomycetota bacterium]|nr:SulP family inorganic anion transporter [Actinomycetota bacterium]